MSIGWRRYIATAIKSSHSTCTLNNLLARSFSLPDGLSAPGYPTAFLCSAKLKCTVHSQSRPFSGPARCVCKGTTLTSNYTECKHARSCHFHAAVSVSSLNPPRMIPHMLVQPQVGQQPVPNCHPYQTRQADTLSSTFLHSS